MTATRSLKASGIFLLALLLFTSFVWAGTGDEPHKISYKVKPNYRDSLTLDVSFQYRSDEAGKLILRYENDSWGDKDIFNCIASFTVLPQPENIQFLRDSSLIIIQTLPYQQLDISYSIKQDFDGPVMNYHRYRPIIQKEYFHLLGMRLFITPDKLFGEGNDIANIAVSWEEPLPGTIFHSSFGSELQQELRVTRESLYASYFVGGDFRRYSYDYKGQLVYFITRGDWQVINDEIVFNLLKKTIPAQMDFWKDALHAPFSVTLLPTNEAWTEQSKSYSLGGSGLTNSSSFKKVFYSFKFLHNEGLTS